MASLHSLIKSPDQEATTLPKIHVKSELMNNERLVYSVMADNGVGEFLWVKQSHESCIVGGIRYCLMDKGHDPEEMSTQLFHEFCEWAEWYMRCEPKDVLHMRKIDWNAFNQAGLKLAIKLKNELDSYADVQYVRAWDDPNRGNSGPVPILSWLAELSE